MKELPILMSGPMVRAILEGRKTHTRRIIKDADWKMVFYDDECDSWCGSNEADFMNDPHAKVIPPKHGVPGDRLWVKETHGPCAGGIVYRADGGTNCPDGGKWKPSIFMPRWACRITLEIEAVRVERLKDISEEDVVAEGIVAARCPLCSYTFADARFHMDHRLCKAPEPPSATLAYRELWESINGPGSWDNNPWVWVIQFRRITP